MDDESQLKLARLIRSQRVAAFGTLREGAPLVSMILFAVKPDFSGFYIHASRLAQHTQDFLADPRVSLLIAEADHNADDPQQLARVSIRSSIETVAQSDEDYAVAKTLYLEKFPLSAQMFQFGDFALYRIRPEKARYVAGFAKAYNLVLDDFLKAARL